MKSRLALIASAILILGLLAGLTTSVSADVGGQLAVAKKKKKKKCRPGQHRVSVKGKNGKKKKCVPNKGKTPDEDDTTGVSVARLTINTNRAAFPNTLVGTQSPPHVFTVTNTGGSVSTPISVSIQQFGGGPGFAVAADSCGGARLAPGAVCSVSVVFQPSHAQSYGSVLNVTAAVGGTAQVGMAGTGVNPPPANLTISPTSFPFPDTAVHHQSDPQDFTVTNTGGSPSGVPFASITEVNNPVPGGPPGFEIGGNNCRLVALPPGGTCHVHVRFKPSTSSQPQPYTAVLHVAASPGGDAQAGLTGTGIP